jgi:Ca2+-binding EF-hand superfamily protein
MTRNARWTASLILCLIALAGVLEISAAQKANVPKPQDKKAIASEEVRDLLLLMDTDKNGKISKQEWMKFMEAEFEVFDSEKKGEIDREELLQSTLAPKHPRTADLGK